MATFTSFIKSGCYKFRDQAFSSVDADETGTKDVGLSKNIEDVMNIEETNSLV